jgi:predicted rRNA methylase YqxC with S4 and FtsJ domains
MTISKLDNKTVICDQSFISLTETLSKTTSNSELEGILLIFLTSSIIY